MEILNGIQRKIRQRQYEFSKHAVDQSIIRAIVAWCWDLRKWGVHYTYSVAIPTVLWSRSLRFINPIRIFVSITESEKQMKGVSFYERNDD